MKRTAIAQLPALFVLLIAAVLAGVASAQQAPPIPTSPQARNMLPDTMAAFADRYKTAASTSQAVYLLPEVTFADRSATAANMPQARNMLPDTIAAFAARSATVANTSQAGYLLQEVTFAARSATAANTSQAVYLLPEVTFADRSATAANLPQAEYLLPEVTFAARSTTAANMPQAEYLLPDVTFAAQSTTARYDDSIEAPQVAAAMQAMAAAHVPSMEAIRLALASAKAAAEAKAQGSQTARLTSSHYAPLGALTSAQAAQLGLPALARVKEIAEQKSRLAILQNPTLLALVQAEEASQHADQTAEGQTRELAQESQSARLATSHYAALGALTSAQARALGLPALAGTKEMAEERYLTAILQNPTLLALVLAEEASQSQHVGLTVGELARLASDESQHEATESPVEAAFEAAEAAHNPGVSMLQVLP